MAVVGSFRGAKPRRTGNGVRMKTIKSLLSSAAILGVISFATTVVASSPDPVTMDEAPPPAAFDAKAEFEGTCTKCHGSDGKGMTKIGDKVRKDGKVMPDLTAPKDATKFEAIIAAGVPDTLMKAYGNKYKPEDIKALADYARGLKK